METKAFKLQKWLRQFGPKTWAQIENAGFHSLGGKTRERMISFGSLRTFLGANDYDSERRYGRIVVMYYESTEIDYTPQRGRKGKKCYPSSSS